MTATPPVRGPTWTSEDADRWHTPWALLGAAYALAVFLLALPRYGGRGATMGGAWASWPRLSTEDQLAFYAALGIAVLLELSRHWPAKRRGWTLLAAGTVAGALSISRMADGLSGPSIALGVGLCWAAAAVHSARLFGMRARMRLTLLLLGAGLSATFALFLMMGFVFLRTPRAIDWALRVAWGYAACVVLCGVYQRNVAIEITRWFARLLVLGVPFFVLIAVIVKLRTPSGDAIAVLRGTLWPAALAITVSLGIANLYDVRMRRSIEAYNAEVFE